MKQYSPLNVSLSYDRFSTTPQGSLTLGAAADQAVSKEFSISAGGSRNILVGVRTSDVTAGAGITLKLQSSFAGTAGTEDWIDGNTASVTAAGWSYIRMNIQTAADQDKLPLADVGRIHCATGAGSAVTIHEILVLQSL